MKQTTVKIEALKKVLEMLSVEELRVLRDYIQSVLRKKSEEFLELDSLKII